MNWKVGLISVFLVIVVIAIAIFTMSVSYSNSEIRLRNLINAKMKDNQSEYDNMWKKISQVAQVAQQDRKTLGDIFVGYANARSGDSKDVVFNWIKESVPNVSSENYRQLQNIITGSRDAWTTRQKELLDLKREHDNLLTLFPSSIFLAGRQPIAIVIITSGRTEKAFETGKDDDVNIF